MSRLLKSTTGWLHASFFLVLSLTATTALAYPPARTAGGMVFDESRDRVVLFGGLTAPDSSNVRYSLNDTWEWTGRRWVRQFTVHAPTPRSGFALVYDRKNQRTLLFGGSDGQFYYNDVWQYKNRDWSQVTVTGTSPEPRRLPAAAYDQRLERVVVYGGADGDKTYHDTWTFDVNTNSWTRLFERGPEIRVGASLAYDASRDYFILLGATSAGTTETHRFSGTTWTKLTPERSPPCATQSALVYQIHEQRLVQTGGLCITNNVTTGRNSETFEWDGTNWIRDQSGSTPGSVAGHMMAYDPRQAQVVLFGGSDFTERFGTYRYKDRWIGSRIYSIDPGPRSLGIGARHPLTNEVVLYGGRDDLNAFTDLWRLERDEWRLVDGSPGCLYPAGTYDSDRKKLVVVCEGSELLEWDGSVWKEFSTFGKDDKPPIRRLSAVAYDPIAKKTFLFGGYDPDIYLREMWGWDGVRWTEVKTESKNSPSSRMLPAMFFDPHSQRILIFGGIGRKTKESSITRYDDMWSFNGTTYTLMTPPTKPSARYGTAVAVAPAGTRNGTERPARVLMFGGKDAEEKYLNELWEWNGTTWSKLETVNTPAARMNAMLVWDELNDRFLLYGGWRGYTLSETWQLKGNEWSLIVDRENHTRPVSASPAIQGGQLKSLAP